MLRDRNPDISIMTHKNTIYFMAGAGEGGGRSVGWSALLAPADRQKCLAADPAGEHTPTGPHGCDTSRRFACQGIMLSGVDGQDTH